MNVPDCTWSELARARELVASELRSSTYAEQTSRYHDESEKDQERILQEMTAFREKMKDSFFFNASPSSDVISSPISGSPFGNPSAFVGGGEEAFSWVSLPPSPYVMKRLHHDRDHRPGDDSRPGTRTSPHASQTSHHEEGGDCVLLTSSSESPLPSGSLADKRNDYVYHEWLVSQYVSSGLYRANYNATEETEVYKHYLQQIQGRLFSVGLRTAELKRAREGEVQEFCQRRRKAEELLARSENTVRALEKRVSNNSGSSSVLSHLLDD
ncbi:hypothetical protein ADEAN_000381400 [Angomonas deanei]|uniref:Uncharacterized protein n=1 Tax=Angomonas deanei TaxID=59799 RepID=A0A7G2CDY7_9TRYP|nr:hypothetical protein ADEAN_000381400 [Angomonas deanei]